MGVTFVEDFLNESDFLTTVSKIHNFHEPWFFHQSTPESTNSFLISGLDNDEYFTHYLFNKLKLHLDGEYVLERVYCNAQWPGREGDIHVDECDLTALLFLQEYKYGWGGFTEVFTDPPCVVHPYPNRLIIFPGMVEHKGYSFAYQNCPIRFSLAFKLFKKRF